MSLQAGNKLGPYEILAEAGIGGMGEVYRARDTRLEREVAIKVLPEQLSANPELRQRFDREAKALSALQHPNICTVHDVGSQNGLDYLVMEYLEGENLATRLRKGPLPNELLLKTAVELADALDKAHRSGVIHRDIKPGNVILTKSGAKLLDFGLAKPAMAASAAAATAPSGAATAAVTVTSPASPLTGAGTLIGTFQYMSPEQIEGKEADPRSDIFAFGALLYEMATGKRAFEGKSQLTVASAILEKDPDPISVLQPNAPAALEHIVTRALAKDPAERWQSARDLHAELQWIMQGSRAGAPAIAGKARRRRRRLQWMVAAAVGWLMVVLVAAAAWQYRSRLVDAEQARWAELELPGGLSPSLADLGAATLSPEGGKLVIIVGSGTTSFLVVRDLRNGKHTELTGTQGAMFPFWSPDGRAIGFFSNGKLRRTSAEGGAVQVLCDAADGRGGTWNSAGVIIFTPNIREPLYKVSENGGTPEAITKIPGAMWTHRNPYFLADGDRFLFTARDTALFGTQGELHGGSLSSGTTWKVIDQASNGQVSGDYLFYVRDRNLMAHGIDTSKLQVKGSPVPIAVGVEFYTPRDVGNFSAAGNSLVFRISPLAQTQATAVERSGREHAVMGEPGYYYGLRLSPDGQKLGLLRTDSNGANGDIWIADRQRNTFSRATFVASPETISLAFSPDSQNMIVSTATGFIGGKMWMQPVSGTTASAQLYESPNPLAIDDWSRDGRYIIGNLQDSKTGMDVVVLPLEGERKPQTIIKSQYWETGGRLSPNGKWLAFQSWESGQPEVYVTQFPEGTQKWQISTGGGGLAVWSGNGRELFFAAEGKIRMLPITDPERFVFGRAVDVFSYPAGTTLPEILFDVSPDGQHLYVLKRMGQSTSRSFSYVVNWRQMIAD